MTTAVRGRHEAPAILPRGDAASPAPVPAVVPGPVAGWRLPTPPSDEEKWAYYGPQRRGVLLLGMAVTAGVIVALVKFSVVSPSTWWGLIAAGVLVAGILISSYTSTRKRRYSRPQHEAIVAGYHPTTWPSVDVFLPSAGEDLAVLANTYAAVATLAWPGRLRMYVLDDSAREEVRALAERYGLEYLTRPDRGRLKKAGNLAFGYSRSDGDLIVVFDADFAPRPDFLTELVPHFGDGSVGIVQSPQFFEWRTEANWLQRGAASTQELFYRWVQPSRDAVGAPICVGTNAIYRRSALQAAGGFAQIGHSEDVHTGVALMKAGYATRYVPVNVAKGLCPDDLDSFISQQYRWCTGSMSLLADRSFHRTKLGWRRKLPFFSGFFYYISTALLVFLAPLPSAYMLWVNHSAVRLANYTFLIPALAFTWVVFPRFMHSSWGPEVLRVQVVYSHAHVVALVDALRGRTAAWVPTGAAPKGSPAPRRVRRLMRVWIPISQLLLWGGIAHLMYRHGVLPYLPIAALVALTSIVQIPILFPLHETEDPRSWVTLPAPRAGRVRVRWGVAAASAVALVAFALAVGTGVGVTLREAAAIAAASAVPGESSATVELPAGATRTAPWVTTPGKKACSTVHASRYAVDVQVGGHRYAVRLDQDIDACADGRHAPVIRTVTPSWRGWDSPAARIEADLDDPVVDAGCTILKGPCTRVVTHAQGKAVSVAGTSVLSADADITTEVGADGATVTTVTAQRSS